MTDNSFNTLLEKHRGKLASSVWTLCLGAGLSSELVPSWFKLTWNLFNKCFKEDLEIDEFNKEIIGSGWSLDNVIQSCANAKINNKFTRTDFNDLITDILYGDLIKEAEKVNLDKSLKIALNNPRQLNKDSTILLADFFEDKYQNTSIFKLSSFFARECPKNKLPTAIINFNADTIFYSLIDLLARSDHYKGPPPHSHPKYNFATILRPLGRAPKLKTPIYHIHGCVKPGIKTNKKILRQYSSGDRLIFLEKDYLKVSSNGSNWPSALFNYFAQMSQIVFFGVSMSDSNMRRWMSGSYDAVSMDIKIISGVDSYKPNHFWIAKNKDKDYKNSFFSSGVSHLGIRIGWIKEWNQIDESLANLLAI